MTELQQPKVVMLDLDGADWSVMDRMLDRNQLSHIGFLLRHGASARLRSTPSLVSAALWTTIMTGKEQDKHGVVVFGDDARSVRSKRIWDIVSDHNRVAGVFGSLVLGLLVN